MYNSIRVIDGLLATDPIPQEVGVLQGDSLSPLIFILFIADLPSALTMVDNLYVILFADDLILYSESLESIQKAVDVLFHYCILNDLSVNTTKTKAMKFRRGGRLKNSDVVLFNDQALSFCNEYEYLGVTVQPTWTFSRHVLKKKVKFMVALNMSKNLRDLSMGGSVRYFNVMLKPIITYGLQAVWEDLKSNHFETLDSCKFAFFKRVLGLHQSTKNRLVALITGLPLLSEELSLNFPLTPELESHLDAFADKLGDINPEFFSTPIMVQTDWNLPLYKKRHLVARVSIHGFHHKICRDTDRHDPEPDCVCTFCEENCHSVLHVFECPILKDWSLGEIDEML